ncbi:MAG: PTS sugar transporter subunit IIA [Pseudomonadota bacterium]
MSLTFESLLNRDDVDIDVEAGSKKHALQLLSQRLAESAPEVPADDVFDALIERERWGCTATEGGVAVPHARLETVERATAVLLRLQEPIDFDSPQDEKVDLLFAFIVPDSTNDADTEALRVLTQRMLNPTLIEALRRGDDRAALFDALKADDNRAARQSAHDLALRGT